MSDLLWQGIQLSVIGLGLTFAALGLLIGAIKVLEAVFRTRSLVQPRQGPRETPVVSSLTRDTEDEEIVAAISVVLAHLRSLEISRIELGTALEEGPGAWWTTGQTQRYSTGGRPPLKSGSASKVTRITPGEGRSQT